MSYMFNNFTLKKFEYRIEILSAIYGLLTYYINKHSKSLIVRFDIHYPLSYQNVCTNEHISLCIELIRRKYVRQGLDPHYIWVREHGLSIHPHYHCALFLDAQKVRSYAHVINSITNTWSAAIGQNAIGCVHNCVLNGYQDSNGKIIRRDVSPEEYQERCQDVFNQLSYLAKAQTKAPNNDGMRNFGMSRLRQH